MKNVELWVHTTCGIEFEVVDATTKESITGRIFWCDDEEADEKEEDGWIHFRKKIEQKGWKLLEEVWS